MKQIHHEKKQRIIGFLTCILAFIFISIALGGEVWIKRKSGHIGLWKSCNYNSCHSLRKVHSELRASQALGVLAAILALVAGLLALIELVLDRMFLYLIPATIFFSFAFALASLSIYTHFANGIRYTNYSFGWSYVIGWISVVVSLCAFLVTFMFEQWSLRNDDPSLGALTFGWKPVSQEPNPSYVIGLPPKF